MAGLSLRDLSHLKDVHVFPPLFEDPGYIPLPSRQSEEMVLHLTKDGSERLGHQSNVISDARDSSWQAIIWHASIVFPPYKV